MGRVYKSRTVRDVLDDPGCDLQFEAFARMILKPPFGLKTMTATPEELAEIRDLLDLIQSRKRRTGNARRA